MQSYYFYEAIEVTISVSDMVQFISNSTADMYGYLYNGTFDPFYPPMDLAIEDDNSAPNNQFSFNVTLDSSRAYILVVTTANMNETGSFVINAYSSFGYVYFNYLGPTTTIPTTTTSESTCRIVH